jgi:predicted AAA+ superfamily ATPase
MVDFQPQYIYIRGMYHRNISANILESLSDTPVLFIRGARQTGKTTLVRDLLPDHVSSGYFTLDSSAVLSAAQTDPAGFIAGAGKPVIIDEIQKAPELLPAIKEHVDRDRSPGQFVLTGSANILTGLKISDSLAGRMELFDLWPLSRAEITGSTTNIVDALFASELAWPAAENTDILEAVTTGGYPEALSRGSEKRRQAWFSSYITAIVERDVRDLSNIQDLTAMPRLLQLLASRTGQLLSYADISRGLTIPQTTLKRYMALLEATFLVHELPAWAVNIGKRVTKAPKLMFTDTGLAAHLSGLNIDRLAQDRPAFGHLLENYVVSEIAKHATWSEIRVLLSHFRAHTGQEVDLILEDAAGRIVGVEIKASATPAAADFKGLKLLAESCPGKFKQGIVLHLGAGCIPFGDNLHALPIGGT